MPRKTSSSRVCSPGALVRTRTTREGGTRCRNSFEPEESHARAKPSSSKRAKSAAPRKVVISSRARTQQQTSPQQLPWTKQSEAQPGMHAVGKQTTYTRIVFLSKFDHTSLSKRPKVDCTVMHSKSMNLRRFWICVLTMTVYCLAHLELRRECL